LPGKLDEAGAEALVCAPELDARFPARIVGKTQHRDLRVRPRLAVNSVRDRLDPDVDIRELGEELEPEAPRNPGVKL
jgi:hypothetical protein